jgi:1-acyl-sn-glycerol-3-phosphate acyltransferase
VRYGKPLDFSRYYGMEQDRIVLRAMTDEIMYELMKLSGQEYVDEYAQRGKGRLPVLRKGHHGSDNGQSAEAGSGSDNGQSAEAGPGDGEPGDAGGGDTGVGDAGGRAGADPSAP